MNYSEDQRKHLEFLQNAITRMNTNSFQLKGLMVTIVAALLTIYSTNLQIWYLLIALPVIIIFLFLDSYYLMLERKIRGIYNCVIGKNKQKIIELYDFPINEFKGNKYSYHRAFFSWTTFGLYFPVFLTVCILILLKCLNYIYD